MQPYVTYLCCFFHHLIVVFATPMLLAIARHHPLAVAFAGTICCYGESFPPSCHHYIAINILGQQDKKQAHFSSSLVSFSATGHTICFHIHCIGFAFSSFSPLQTILMSISTHCLTAGGTVEAYNLCLHYICPHLPNCHNENFCWEPFYDIVWFWCQLAALCSNNAKGCSNCIILLVAALCLCCIGTSYNTPDGASHPNHLW